MRRLKVMTPLLDGAEQGGVRADFQEDVMLIFQQALKGSGEERWLSNVPRPVARMESIERSQQIGAQRLHLGTVRGKIDLHHLAENVATLQLIENGGERGRI